MDKQKKIKYNKKNMDEYKQKIIEILEKEWLIERQKINFNECATIINDDPMPFYHLGSVLQWFDNISEQSKYTKNNYYIYFQFWFWLIEYIKGYFDINKDHKHINELELDFTKPPMEWSGCESKKLVKFMENILNYKQKKWL